MASWRLGLCFRLGRDRRKARVLRLREAPRPANCFQTDKLERLIDKSDRYKKGKAEALAELDRGLRLGGRLASREALHER